MSIWTCKKAGLICLALLTSGCDIPEGDGGFNLFSGALGGLIDTAPLAQADMAGDQVKLTPALGYCVDPQNLASNFALIARCDTLGGEPDKTGAPLLIITAAVTRLSGDATLSEVLLGVGDGTVSRVGEIDGIGTIVGAAVALGGSVAFAVEGDMVDSVSMGITSVTESKSEFPSRSRCMYNGFSSSFRNDSKRNSLILSSPIVSFAVTRTTLWS